MSISPDPYDAVVIGSGFGGAFAARELVAAGLRVAMVERGGWIARGPENWTADGAVLRTSANDAESTFQVLQTRGGKQGRLCACVGGASVFYGGASFRFREADFRASPEIAGEEGVGWPIGYADMAPFYDQAEALLGVAGEAGADPTEPPRNRPFPLPPAPMADISRRVASAAEAMGLHPFPIPLNLGYDRGCTRCGTCDGFPCALGAKGDVATRLIPELTAAGMDLFIRTVATRLEMRDGRVEAVHCRDRETAGDLRVETRAVVLAAGALATPHLLLASGADRLSTAPAAVGRYLVRHCNGIVFGVFPTPPDPRAEHHKQLAIHDFYFGVDAPDAPKGKLGSIQQVPTPALALVQGVLPPPVVRTIAPVLRRMTGLLCIAEDQPRAESGVRLVEGGPGLDGLPRMTVTHHYTPRDLAARAALQRRAGAVLRRAGAWWTIRHAITTFSHAAGTVRMGDDPNLAPLDADGRFRGLENLFVTDASAFSTAAGVNPSLTIAANALRVGRIAARQLAPTAHAEASR